MRLSHRSTDRPTDRISAANNNVWQKLYFSRTIHAHRRQWWDDIICVSKKYIMLLHFKQKFTWISFTKCVIYVCRPICLCQHSTPFNVHIRMRGILGRTNTQQIHLELNLFETWIGSFRHLFCSGWVGGKWEIGSRALEIDSESSRIHVLTFNVITIIWLAH